jgi:glycosidase
MITSPLFAPWPCIPATVSTALLAMALLHSSSHASPARIALDGEWLFRSDPSRQGIVDGWYRPAASRDGWTTVRTPAFWEAYPGLASYDGWGWFVRTFRLDTPIPPMSIHFAGVDDDAEVWVNGVDVGTHTGYSDPFALDVSKAVRPGENVIAVLVKDYAGGGGVYRPVTLTPTDGLEELLTGPLAGVPARPSEPWVKEAVIYSVYLRSFSPEGTFAGLQRRLPELKAMGVTVLWLLPIHPVGVERRKGALGSPYAVQDFYAVNPEFGTLDDFRSLVGAAHAQGMKLIIDLVANHTSWDSRLMADHPEWFTKDSTGTIVPPNADWTDVADLDYAQAGVRTYMIEMMCWWVRDVGIDGFRCDVAELVPTDFWDAARGALDAIRPVMMLSEGSLPEHHVKAFDVTYAWNIYDALDPMLRGVRPPDLIDQILRNEALQFPAGSLRMRFTTNHDKNAWDAPATEKFGADGVALGNVLTFTMPGVPLIYTGEEVGNRTKLDLFERVSVDWSPRRTMGDLFASLARLRREHAALVSGSMERLARPGAPGVYAFRRTGGADTVAVFLNFGSTPVRVDGVPGTTRDAFSGQVLPGGTAFTLGPRGYRVLSGAH